jgi:flagellar protein FlbD
LQIGCSAFSGFESAARPLQFGWKEAEKRLILLTQLNGASIYVNSNLIETFESTPDTVLTLTTGRKIIVKESPKEIVSRAAEYASRVSCSLPGVKKEVA